MLTMLLSLVLLLWIPAVACADVAAEAIAYRCDGLPLVATQHRGAVDDPAIPNQAAGTFPGAFVVLQWGQLQLQLPRTNNAGAPSYTDGRWWWSLEDPRHPDFRQRQGLGTVVRYICGPDPA